MNGKTENNLQKTEKNELDTSSNSNANICSLLDFFHLSVPEGKNSGVTPHAETFRTPQPFSTTQGKKITAKLSSVPIFKEGSIFGDHVIIRKLSSGRENLTFLTAPKNCTEIAGNPDLGVLKLYPSPAAPEKFVQILNQLSAKTQTLKDSLYATPEILCCDADEKGFCWSITKFIERPSLESFIQAKSPLPEHKALFTIYTIASLLAKLYPQWGPHGRLKPSKILFGLKKPPFFLGFGQNSFLQKNEASMLPFEKFFYASPEYISDGVISRQSDMYSLGIIFFRLLSGVLPFYSENIQEIKNAHLSEKLPAISEKNHSVRISTPTLGILNRMTMKDPAERFADLHQLLEALIQADDALPQEEKDK